MQKLPPVTGALASAGIVALLAVMLAIACTTVESPARAYVEADRATYDFLAPIVSELLEREASVQALVQSSELEPEARAALVLEAVGSLAKRDNIASTLRTWELRIRAQEHAHGILEPAETPR